MVQEIETLKLDLTLNKLLLHIIFTLVSLMSFAQNLHNHEFDKVKWQEIKDKIRYEGKDHVGESWAYENDQEYKDAIKRRQQDSESGNGKTNTSEPGMTPEKHDESAQFDWSPNFSPNFTGLSWLGWVFAILIGGALIAFIIYLIVSNDNTGAKSVEVDDFFENIAPADIPLTALEKRLKSSLDDGDYRGAVRIYYLFILKDISIKKWVIWEKDKTNMHYLREMNGKDEFDDFNKAISYFEVIWYGKRQIDKVQFTTVQPYFTNLLQKLGVA